MEKLDKIIVSTATTLLALLGSQGTLASAAIEAVEKCYGIVKAGKNDCQTATASCAGSSTQDKQRDAFILLPTGTCDKIMGGSTILSNNIKEGSNNEK